MSQNKPLSDEQLAAIKARVEGDDDPTLYWNGMGGALEQAEEDRATLLAEVERLRERESALLVIVRAVARATVITDHAPSPDTLCPYHEDGKAWSLRTRALALLGRSWLGTRQGSTEREQRSDTWYSEVSR